MMRTAIRRSAPGGVILPGAAFRPRAGAGGLAFLLAALLFPLPPLTAADEKAAEKQAAREKFEELRKQFEKEKQLEAFERTATVERFGTARCVESVRFLESLYKEEQNSVLWMAASRALGGIGSPEAARALLATGLPALQDLDFGLEAIEAALKRSWEPKAEEWLLANAITPATRKHEKTYEAMIKGLARFKSPKRFALLEAEVAQAASPTAQVTILEALRPQATEKQSKLALQLIGSPKPEVQVAAYDFLDAIDTGKHRARFQSGLKSPHWEVRAACLDALSRREDAQIVKLAAPLLKDKDKRVQIAATRALLRRGGAEVIEPLFRALEHAQGRVQDDLADALGRLTGKDFGPSGAQWESWWAVNKDKGGQYTAMSPEEFSLLKQAAAESKVTVSYHGLRVLSAYTAFIFDTSESMGEVYVPKEERKPEPEPAAEKGKTTVVGPGKGGGEKDGKKAAAKKVTRLEVAKKAVHGVLDGLKDGQQFDIVRFDTFVVDLVPASLQREPGKLAMMEGEVRQKAKAFVEEAKPSGLTNISGALQAAFQYDEIDTIYLLSDGAPTSGITDPKELLDTVERWNRRRRVKINTIGFDMRPQEKALLRTLAERNYGVFVER